MWTKTLVSLLAVGNAIALNCNEYSPTDPHGRSEANIAIDEAKWKAHSEACQHYVYLDTNGALQCNNDCSADNLNAAYTRDTWCVNLSPSGSNPLTSVLHGKCCLNANHYVCQKMMTEYTQKCPSTCPAPTPSRVGQCSSGADGLPCQNNGEPVGTDVATVGDCSCDCTNTLYEGSNCQTPKSCSVTDDNRPLNANGNVHDSTIGNCPPTLSSGSSCTPSCQSGYTLSGDIDCSFGTLSVETCDDIDECADSNLNDCHTNAVCNNVIGGYNCLCSNGYNDEGSDGMASGSGCLPEPCDASTPPMNGGNGTCAENLASGSSCQPTCDTGYTVSGTSSCLLGELTPATCDPNPCDASTPPTNGGNGTCTENLASGSSCQPTCDTGYTVSGTSSCEAGQLTPATCEPNPCDASVAPTNGGNGTCTENLASGSSCQPTCDTGYTVSGTSSCEAGQLSPATCEPNPCDASTPPTNGGNGTCTENLASGSSCQPTCDTGYTVSGTSSCEAGQLTPATCEPDSCEAVDSTINVKNANHIYCGNGGVAGGVAGSCTCTCQSPFYDSSNGCSSECTCAHGGTPSYNETGENGQCECECLDHTSGLECETCLDIEIGGCDNPYQTNALPPYSFGTVASVGNQCVCNCNQAGYTHDAEGRCTIYNGQNNTCPSYELSQVGLPDASIDDANTCHDFMVQANANSPDPIYAWYDASAIPDARCGCVVYNDTFVYFGGPMQLNPADLHTYSCSMDDYDSSHKGVSCVLPPVCSNYSTEGDCVAETACEWSTDNKGVSSCTDSS